ncbi:hypothetical protein DFP72DRAFT_848639 [Ephemerocybe angulata]|uniref:Uncharacterized protein n=1 Tax=Ephemerocybe angulata TaxID=980116 RepID=A0A8H6HVN6_9AGAR|nr:hypothetical protein DFP72DRAFT_848639 [Tulosesus angulatus]
MSATSSDSHSESSLKVCRPDDHYIVRFEENSSFGSSTFIIDREPLDPFGQPDPRPPFKPIKITKSYCNSNCSPYVKTIFGRQGCPSDGMIVQQPGNIAEAIPEPTMLPPTWNAKPEDARLDEPGCSPVPTCYRKHISPIRPLQQTSQRNVSHPTPLTETVTPAIFSTRDSLWQWKVRGDYVIESGKRVYRAQGFYNEQQGSDSLRKCWEVLARPPITIEAEPHNVDN